MVRRLISAGHDPAKWLLPKLQQFFEAGGHLRSIDVGTHAGLQVPAAVMSKSC